MNCAEKMFKNAECWDNFEKNCNDANLKQLVDIFYPMCIAHEATLSDSKKKKLEIDVGKKKKDFFEPYLSVSTSKFSFVASSFDNEPQLIFRDETDKTHRTLAVINLTEIKDLCIEKEVDDSITFYRYNIYFTYNNTVDYHVHIVNMG